MKRSLSILMALILTVTCCRAQARQRRTPPLKKRPSMWRRILKTAGIHQRARYHQIVLLNGPTWTRAAKAKAL